MRNEMQQKKKIKSPIIFSIVIPTLNEEIALPKLLTDLEYQSLNSQQFEVLVVDGGSADLTVNKAREFASKGLQMAVVSCKVANVSYQRNTGAQKAKGVWILYIDADSRVGVNFLSQLNQVLHDTQSIDVFSCLMSPDTTDILSRSISSVANSMVRLYGKFGKFFAFGALLGVRASLARKISFDDSIKIGEDQNYVLQARKLGATCRVFHTPKYVFSLRRFRKEGILKMLFIELKIAVKTRGSFVSIQSDHGYTLAGGTFHEKSKSG